METTQNYLKKKIKKKQTNKKYTQHIQKKDNLNIKETKKLI